MFFFCIFDKYAKPTNKDKYQEVSTYFSTALYYHVRIGTSVFLTDFPNLSFINAMHTGSAAFIYNINVLTSLIYKIPE